MDRVGQVCPSGRGQANVAAPLPGRPSRAWREGSYLERRRRAPGASPSARTREPPQAADRWAAVLPAQKVRVRLVDPRGPFRARPGGGLCVLRAREAVTPRVGSAGSSHLLVVSPLGSPVVFEVVTHTGPQEPWLTALPVPSRAAWDSPELGHSFPGHHDPQECPSWSRDGRGQPVVTPVPHSLPVTQLSA